ncbi:class I SAM-dependent RNA methyltransferase [Sphingomonas sp. SUN039]|uniref:class I SAM-dependent RNA methyltransferase n=1 Tax=Sphingomonas sp. SUN039 TaxID=2937787 RepID=UPI002164EF19|nr:class I SAM-dependent RNA methyltransferase [Sphingomonas sp. SUN039]UVO53874.1 class I SAM-dependent RNA methyltransferase [Sphingomonas sp. SUN039]
MSETIVRLAARGDGVTESGRFVAGTAPGDRVEADGTITPGPHRAIPPCRHFGICGGCQLQHVDDASYAQFVIDRITGALAEQRIDAPPFASVHLSPPNTRRRASLRAERRGKQVLLGFNEGASHRIVDLRECHVLLPELVALIAPLRRLLAMAMPDRGRATVTLTRADQGVDVLLAGFVVEGLAAIEMLNDFAETHRLARLSLDEGYGPSARWCPVPPTITLGGTPVALPEGAFLQATADGEAALVAAVRETVGNAATIIDLFAGLGTFALSLGGQVRAVEGSRDAALALLATRRVPVEHRDLFRRPLSVVELANTGAVVLDPPRAGAREQVAELAKSDVPRIAYVSCNPATFARDARTLIDGGYTLARVAPVGQFRWSTHVELAAAFTR